MCGADPRHFHCGTKTGCRRLFQEERVAHPIGHENLHSIADAVSAIAAMRTEKPELEHVLIKLNEGISGDGNARIDVRDLPAPGSPQQLDEIEARLREMSLENASLTIDSYVTKLEATGGIVEELITGDEFRS